MEAFKPPVTKRGRSGGKVQSSQEVSKKEVSSKGKKGKGIAAKVVKPGKAAKNVREKKLLLRGNVPIQAAFPTGTKTTKDHVTEVVFSQRVYIVYIKSVCFRVQVFKSVCFLTVISMIPTY